MAPELEGPIKNIRAAIVDAAKEDGYKMVSDDGKTIILQDEGKHAIFLEIHGYKLANVL
jgi:hypothetical protein